MNSPEILGVTPPRPTPGATQTGFTLLEILVAVAILGVAMVSLLGLQARNLRLIAQTQDLTTAAMLASEKVALLKAGGFPELGVTEGLFDQGEDGDDRDFAPADRFRWKTDVEATIVPTLRRVVVSVGLIDDEDDLVRFRFVATPEGVQ